MTVEDDIERAAREELAKEARFRKVIEAKYRIRSRQADKAIRLANRRDGFLTGLVIGIIVGAALGLLAVLWRAHIHL